MIKIEELALGDWVMVPIIEEPVEVMGLVREGCAERVTCGRGITTICCDIKNIQPIPPFLEVLEKLGFVKEALTSRWICSLEDELRLIAVGAGYASHMLYERYLGDGEWNVIASCTCHSIHEIQHFIALAHIDKDIAL